MNSEGTILPYGKRIVPDSIEGIELLEMAYQMGSDPVDMSVCYTNFSICPLLLLWHRAFEVVLMSELPTGE